MAPPSPNTRESKVLIVDPDHRSVHELASALRQVGFVALEASSFSDGKRLWHEQLPDALIAEVRLGQFNGLQLLVRAKLERPEVAGIITCAFPDVVLEAETRRFGGMFLLKPVDPAEIIHLIQVNAEQRALIGTGKTADRRVSERRKIPIADFVPEQRHSDRRSSSGKERRIGERRQVEIPNFSHNRRAGDRRRGSAPRNR
jgi:DNA-binding response OmpR family regulator